MRAMKRSIHIDAPVETVFDSFKDPAKFVDLDPGGTHVDDVKLTNPGNSGGSVTDRRVDTRKCS
jgi:carbon monoxide dehydrogenase subunit G